MRIKSGIEILSHIKSPKGRKAVSLAVFIVLGLILFLWFGNIMLALIISACISIYALDLLYSLQKAAEGRLHRQLINFLEHMIIMLRAGKTIRHIFLNSWPKFKPPLGSHLKYTAERLEVDPDLETALNLFEKRSGSREAGLIAAGIKINSRVGGDLVVLLESISITLRKSLRSRARMENLTLQSRFSANVISFFPIAALILLYMFYSASIIDFFLAPAGNIILVAGGSLEIAGIIFMKKITGG